MSVRLGFMTALWVTMAMAFAGAATAGQINPGDLIVVDRGNGTLDDINPTTGATNFVIASGFSNPQGLAINALGTIFVSDIGTSTIDAVNPTTGVVTTFSGNGVGTGPALNRPFQMQFFGGTLYLAEGGIPNGSTTAVYAIDAAGNRTTVAGNNGSNNPFAESLAGLALSSKGTIYASEATGPHTIYQISAGTGTVTPLTSAVTAPQGLAFGANGQLLAVSGNPTNPLIASIDPTTGNTTTLSDNNGVGTGPAYGSLRGITVGNGSIYVTDVGNNEIFKVDAANGDRSVLSGNGVGGTDFGALTYGIAVYPSASSVIPEPSSLALLAIGAVGLVVYKHRRCPWRVSSAR